MPASRARPRSRLARSSSARPGRQQLAQDGRARPGRPSPQLRSSSRTPEAAAAPRSRVSQLGSSAAPRSRSSSIPSKPARQLRSSAAPQLLSSAEPEYPQLRSSAAPQLLQDGRHRVVINDISPARRSELHPGVALRYFRDTSSSRSSGHSLEQLEDAPIDTSQV